MRSSRAISLILLTVFCCSSRVLALEEEQLGNSPLNALNYKDWPGMMPVIDHPSRVFHIWVNGDEWFYYRGDTPALNDVLLKFADIRVKDHEVVLRPAPGTVDTLVDPKQSIPFNWNMHLVGGIAAYMSTRDLGDLVWNKSPMLTVYVGGDIQLKKMVLPPSVSVMSVADLAKRYRRALASTEQDVRGWSAGELADLDPYDAQSVTAITKLLDDDVNWVRLCATMALSRFGKIAEPALPSLTKALNTPDESLKTEIAKTINSIRQAGDPSAAEREHRAALQSIADFCKSAQANSK